MSTPSDARPGKAAEYPKRPSHFAHKYTRLLTKTCAANEITALGCWLCTVIAHLEDSRRYTGPISFYNEQLAPLLGVKKWETLERARRLAVDHGWLAYQCGGRHKPGYYHVTIPAGLEGLDDAPCDESSYPKNGYLEGDQGESRYPKNGYNMGISADTTGEQEGGSFLPSPVPTPVPKEESAGADEPPAALLALIDGWNALPPGIVKPGNGARRDPIAKALLTRWEKAQKIPELREAFSDIPRILDAIRKAKACHGESWFDLEFLFSKKDDQYRVVRILNGKFDWSKNDGNGKPLPPGPGQRHPADANRGRGVF